jgi:hypothetical protein
MCFDDDLATCNSERGDVPLERKQPGEFIGLDENLEGENCQKIVFLSI